MLLPYGKKEAHLVHISEVESGIGAYYCPYCEGQLMAKKGKKMAHHFAHVGASCWSASSYDFFGIKKQSPLYRTLSEYADKKQKEMSVIIQKLTKQQAQLDRHQHQIQESIRKMVHSLTDLQESSEAARTALRELKQYLYDEFKAIPDLSAIRHPKLFSYTNGERKINYQEALQAENTAFYPSYYHYPLLALKNYHKNRYRLKEVADKLALYEQDLAYFKGFHLYFLKIELDENRAFYKIGLSSRPLAVRIREIERVLKKHFRQLSIEVLYQLKNVAFLENFFKQKYREHRYHIADFTEYFVLDAYLLAEILKEFEMIEEVGFSQT
ncbi:MAG: competence protein CoiA family protein [Bacteroidota bacterium]